MAVTQVSAEKFFDGHQYVYAAESKKLAGQTKFGVYVPPIAATKKKCPVVIYLSGLTCTEENFIVKSGFQKFAAELGLIVVNPDTSPRGAGVGGEDASYDLGTGAGFYLDATEEKWAKNYNMYSFVVEELPSLVQSVVPAADFLSVGIFGHSMGGHGSLSIYLKNFDKFKSCSAFAPICNPINCAWGQKAFSSYLGDDRSKWAQYDSCELVKNLPESEIHKLNQILIDQGSKDQFLSENQLLPDNLISVAKEKGVKVEYRLQDGYNHGYSFVSTFMQSHLKFHASILTN